jgi:hypothetical protein
MFGVTKRDFDGGAGLDTASNTWYIIHQSKFALMVSSVTAAIWGSTRTVVRTFGLFVPGRTAGHIIVRVPTKNARPQRVGKEIQDVS